MQKLVIVINGRSGVGKDALIQSASQRFSLRNVSSITPIKELALLCGWNGVKDERGRKLLVDLKEAFVAYNDLPFCYLKQQYTEFLQSEEQLMFVHIREPHEIQKFKSSVPCKTVLVIRSGADKFNLINDDNVTDFEYDITFDNSEPLKRTGPRFTELLGGLLN